MNKKINVLVVEDSPVAQLLLVHILNADPRLNVLGTASNGEEALAFLKWNKPDVIKLNKPGVIVMDIQMPGMDGYEVTRRIMEIQPVPIVVCSASVDPAEVATTFRALEAGALAVAAKPVGLGHPEYANMAAKLVEAVALMSEVRVVRRWPRTGRSDAPVVIAPAAESRISAAGIRVVAIGTSTGGPSVLQTILAGLPRDFPIPVLIVQHIAAGFLAGLVEWLAQTTGFPIHIATHGEPVLPGRAYLAPDGVHMGLGANGQIALSKQAPDNGLRPSVAHLFRSVASVCGGSAAGVLLTGMGRDGAEELKHLRNLGAFTIAQDAESSVVHGMPGEAIKLGAAGYILAPDKNPAVLSALAAKKSNEPRAPSRQ